MKKLLIFGFALLGICFSSKAQQDPQFSQNMYNRLFPNPGVAGTNGSICATVLGREQWVGFEGQPGTYLFSTHGPVPILRGGVGLSVAQDQIGQFQDFHLKAAYSYHLDIPAVAGQLGIGIGLGMLNRSIGSNWTAIDDIVTDPKIPDAGLSATAFDLDFGAYFANDDLYAGISTTHLSAPDLGVNSTVEVKRHYYLMAGYNYDRLLPNVVFQPSLFVKSDGASAQIDVNVSAVYNNMFWGGLTYRLQDAIVAMAGVDYKLGGTGLAGGTLRLGYAYDITTSLVRTASSGSHELLLNYCFNIPKKIKIERHKSVRFL